jgi:hypothetical protein
MSKTQENATQIDDWILITDHLPNVGDKVEIMHFGNDEDARIYDTAKMTAWGVHPDNDRGGHGKMSTVTHWRHLSV